MVALRSDITEAMRWFRGAHKLLEWTILEEDNITVPAGMDTWTLAFYLKERSLDTDPVLVLDADVVQPDEGLVQVTVERVDTFLLAPGGYHYTLWRSDPGFEDGVAYGSAELLQPDVPILGS